MTVQHFPWRDPATGQPVPGWLTDKITECLWSKSQPVPGRFGVNRWSTEEIAAFIVEHGLEDPDRLHVDTTLVGALIEVTSKEAKRVAAAVPHPVHADDLLGASLGVPVEWLAGARGALARRVTPGGWLREALRTSRAEVWWEWNANGWRGHVGLMWLWLMVEPEFMVAAGANPFESQWHREVVAAARRWHDVADPRLWHRAGYRADEARQMLAECRSDADTAGLLVRVGVLAALHSPMAA